MKRDWFWGIVAGFIAFVGALIGFGRILPGPAFERIGLALATGALVIATIGGSWLSNRRSIRRIRRAGGKIRMIVHPEEAIIRFLWHFIRFFTVMYGVSMLFTLLFDYRMSASAAPLWVTATGVALYHSLRDSTYYAPKPEKAAA
ncbi:hypothetical protein [Sphingomonas colocasiae]|uniref:DUF2178 domain-containing protein n=1 Tax=Sphingomonas colocasiae TaxID=1848973 RepID=A0ABS7PV37_9SPHN|nr:hypothetical protein [Sphingomonas colocasiae]MBY8825063.1 hypothetical protein [Sphingomonas colocasiae]